MSLSNDRLSGARFVRRKSAALCAAIEFLESRTLLTSVVVNTISDTATGTGVVTLADAVKTANSSSTPTTITFSPTVFAKSQTITLNGVALELSNTKESTTITGPSARVTISGNKKSREFIVDKSVIASFSALTLSGGHANATDGGSGGGVVNNGNLTLTNSTITGNAAVIVPSGDFPTYGNGAGIENTGTLSVTGCTISANTGTGYSYCAGIDNKGTLTVTNSTVSSNLAGNGIKNDGTANLTGVTVSHNSDGGIENTGKITLTNSTVSGNSKGGFTNSESASTATLTNVTISGNTGTAGSGILNISGTVTLLNSTISGNTSGTSSEEGYGGGVENRAKLNVTDSTISGNVVVGGTGGGINNEYDGTATLINTTIFGNKSELSGTYGGNGGGFCNAGGTAKLENVTISGNTANDAGGLYNGLSPSGFGPDSLTISNSIVAGNTAPKGDDVDGFDAVKSLGYNLVGTYDGIFIGPASSRGWTTHDILNTKNADLGPLANNGGPTLTLLPLAASPAINYGSNSLIPAGTTTDQRGLPRISGSTATVDIGAVEVQSAKVTITLTAPKAQTAFVGIAHAVTLGSFTQSGATGPYSVDVNWGDGTTDTKISVTSAGTIPASTHTFAKSGTFTVSEVVTDAKSNTSNKVTFSESVSVPPPATVTGEVFDDLYGNGKLDTKETGLSGWIVYVDANGNGQFDPTEQYALTNSNGDYTLTLTPGTYTIDVQVRGGYEETAPHALEYKITVSPGEKISGELFGEKAISPV